MEEKRKIMEAKISDLCRSFPRQNPKKIDDKGEMELIDAIKQQECPVDYVEEALSPNLDETLDDII